MGAGRTTYNENGPTIRSTRWRALVREAKQRLEPVCWFCGVDIDMSLPGTNKWGCTVHHINARAFGGDVIVPLEELALAHNYCNARHGAHVKHAPRARRPATMDGERALFDVDEGVSIGAGLTLPAPVDFSLPNAKPARTRASVPIPEETAEGYLNPDTYNPPRLETLVPTDVAGTLGPEAADWLDRWLDIKLWPWQEHVLNRALEVREDGSFRWPVVVLTVPRQCGKSWLSRAVMSWRLFQGERFGEAQTLLHVSSQRQIARELWKMSARELEAKGQAKVRMSNGQEAIELPDTSQWMVAAATPAAAPGLSISMAFVDECWAVDLDVVTQGIMPTTLQRRDAQVWLVSTAGASRSELLRTFRDQALAQLESDQPDVLLIEWSASPEREVDDPAGWREASPIWDARREAQVARNHRLMRPNAFAQQMLNRWVVSAAGFLSEGVWRACESQRELPPAKDNPGCVAIETSVDGMPIGAVLAVRDDDGTIVVRTKVCHSHHVMWRWLEQLAKERRGITVLHHATVRVPDVRGAVLEQVKAADQVAGFAPTKEAIEERFIAHDGDQVLAEHMLMAAVWQTGDGHAQLSQRASEGPIYLARALVWAAGHELRPSTRRRHLVLSAA